MTLQEIHIILTDKIDEDVNKALRLSPETISSPAIKKMFSSLLLDTDLVIDEAILEEDYTKSVKVSGSGNSFVFNKTKVTALTFTVDDKGVPAIAITASAIIEDEEGWTLGESFPVLKQTDWGGHKDKDDETKWVQELFFTEGTLALKEKGLGYTGTLDFTKGLLKPLKTVFNRDKVAVAVSSKMITLNKGKETFKADEDTAVPEMVLTSTGDVPLKVGNFEFTFSFGMQSTAVFTDEKDKTKPVPKLAMTVTSMMPVDVKDKKIEIRLSANFVKGDSKLTLKADVSKEKGEEMGISELISLGNNENVLSFLPSNIPVIHEIILTDWTVAVNTADKSLLAVTMGVATKKDYSWDLIPDIIAISDISMVTTLAYPKKKLTPSLKMKAKLIIGTATKPPVIQLSADFPTYVFTGALAPAVPIDLTSILNYFTKGSISLPDMKLKVLDVTIDSKKKSYLLKTELDTDLEVNLGITTIAVKKVKLNVNYVASKASGSLTGVFAIGKSGKSVVNVTAAYASKTDTWTFSGELDKDSTISLQDVITAYLPADYKGFDATDITVRKLFASFAKEKKPELNAYKFKIAADWKLDLGTEFNIKAEADISYSKSKQYTGFVKGMLDIGGLNLAAQVNFNAKKKSDYTFTLNDTLQAKLQDEKGDKVLRFTFLKDISLGDVITMLAKAATGDDITLPAPWDVINHINLKDLSFFVNITKKQAGIIYEVSANLEFMKIEKISLTYNYGNKKKPTVNFKIEKGKFLGLDILPQPWNVLEPSEAPKVPGKGTEVFELEFLGMGQHVSLASGVTYKSVAEAVVGLGAAFEPEDPELLKAGEDDGPLDGTGLKFNSATNWIIGSKFTILETFKVSIVFLDPDLYGLALNIDGPKAKVFQGLNFEVLYRKVSDTTGVYQIFLKLPDAIRQLEFGAVSVTLPSLKLFIYTNGDFKVDLGFPVDEDFSESFGLQMLPFTGAGGFYFGVLSAETSETTPVTTKGNFSPVIVFGLGLQAGIGKTIDKGIFKAGISISVIGILEGTFAQYNSFTPVANKDEVYYYIMGKLAILGHVYGSVDLGIISAEVDLKVFVSARVIMESYQPILLNLAAGVSVSLRVKINLGLFKIYINLSYSTSIEESFTIGSASKAPWMVGDALFTIPFKQPLLNAGYRAIPQMNWLPIIPQEKIGLDIIFTPQLTAATDAGDTAQKAKAVAMLYLETSTDQQSKKKLVPSKKGNGMVEEDYPFTKFAKGTMLWVIGAYLNKTTEGMPVEDILKATITAADLSDILSYLSQDSLAQTFTVADIMAFMETYLDVTVKIPGLYNFDSDAPQVSIFPMLPLFTLETPTETVYFDDEKAKYLYDKAQLDLIRKLFKELAVRNRDEADNKRLRDILDEPKQSLASFMLIDYIMLLAKESVQRGINRLNALPVQIPAGQTISGFVNNNQNLNITAEALAFSNRTIPLSADAELVVNNIKYTVKRGDTAQKLAAKFQPSGLKGTAWGETWLDKGNKLVAGETITLPVVKHHTSATKKESLLSIANKYGVAVETLIKDNLNTGLFSADQKLIVPFADSATVADLLVIMESKDNHDFENLSGLSANIMLQGLRVPIPKPDSQIGEPQALYSVTGQQVDASTLIADDAISLSIPEPLSWLHMGAKDGVKLPFTFSADDISYAQELQKTVLTPTMLQILPADLFEVQARKFSLPNSISWQSPTSKPGKTGTADPNIWVFNNSLQALLTADTVIEPKVNIWKQVQESLTKTGAPVQVNSHTWSTKIDVRLRQVKSISKPDENAPNVYEVQGVNPDAMALLCNLIKYYGNNPGTKIIESINVLYAKEPVKDGQTEPPTGLRSDGLDNTTVFLLQNNLSTLSNPPQVKGTHEQLTGANFTMFGMTAIDFVKYLWEAAVVGTGGYYLYYRVNDSKAGLPDYLFNGNADSTITLLLEYNIIDNVLHNFLNSVVIDSDPVNIKNEILYIETVSRAVTGVKMHPGDTLAAMAKKYRTSVSEIARQNSNITLHKGLSLQTPGTHLKTSLHVTANADTLHSLAGKLGTSVTTLAHLNKNIAHLFAGDLHFDSSIQVKVATVPSGNIGFKMKRMAPENVTPALPATQLGLQELYQLLEYNVSANNDFDKSNPGLPVAVGDKKQGDEVEKLLYARPSALTVNDWNYDKIVPVYAFAKAPALNGGAGDDVPLQKNDPYRAIGKTAEINMRWNDIFGNQTAFNTYPPQAKLAPVKVGYIDPVTGLSQFPNLSGSYTIANNAGNSPELKINLSFNAQNYAPANEGDESWKEKVAIDREAYKNIYYQLIQPDVTITVACSIDANGPAPINNQGVKDTLIKLALDIYQYLGAVITDPATPAPVGVSIAFDLKDSNTESLYALVTTLTISRNLQLVDDNFKDEPSVSSSATVLGPDLGKTGQVVNADDDAITVQQFAQNLQQAFPLLKAASGSPDSGSSDDLKKQLWLIRVSDTSTGVQFKVLNKDKPAYFALKPLSKHLLSRERVKVYNYSTGSSISVDPTYELKDFNGVDIERLAADFLAAMDMFLQADLSIPAFLLQNSAEIVRLPGNRTPYSAIIRAKELLAKNIVKGLTNVLDDGNLPVDAAINSARERLKQQLLIQLSDAYTIDTVLQFNMAVKSAYKDGAAAPNLFGKVIDPEKATGADQAYSFSTTRFSLADTQNNADYLNILFNTKKENTKKASKDDANGADSDLSFFPISLNLQLNSLEHQIKAVPQIKDYQESSWLTFILPFNDADTSLGKLNIPLPLRAYPTAPSLAWQKFTLPTDGGATDKLQQAMQWDFEYAYNYLRASQDSINTEIMFNVSPQANTRMANADDYDLFDALLQFTSVYPQIQADMNNYLLNQTDIKSAITAMQSFAWLAERVANSWGRWFQAGAYKASSADEHYKFIITEDKATDRIKNALVLTIAPQGPPMFTKPVVVIDDYLIDDTTFGENTFAYYKNDAKGIKKYLTFDEGKAITQRAIKVKGLNIIGYESAWAGISVVRNLKLVPGVATNPDFIYETPSIRFVNVLTPLLDPDMEIDIAEFTPGDKNPLQVYLSNFLQKLFEKVEHQPATRTIKIATGYSYELQETTGLKVNIPISITTPFTFNIPGDWDQSNCNVLITPQSAFVCQLSALLSDWFRSSQPITTHASFKFDITLFSGQLGKQLPTLRLSNLFIAVDKLSNF